MVGCPNIRFTEGRLVAPARCTEAKIFQHQWNASAGMAESHLHQRKYERWMQKARRNIEKTQGENVVNPIVVCSVW